MESLSKTKSYAHVYRFYPYFPGLHFWNWCNYIFHSPLAKQLCLIYYTRKYNRNVCIFIVYIFVYIHILGKIVQMVSMNPFETANVTISLSFKLWLWITRFQVTAHAFNIRGELKPRDLWFYSMDLVWYRSMAFRSWSMGLHYLLATVTIRGVWEQTAVIRHGIKQSWYKRT